MTIIVVKINKTWFRLNGLKNNPPLPFYILRYCDIAYNVTDNQLIKYRGGIDNIPDIINTIKMMLWLDEIPILPVNNEKEMTSMYDKLGKGFTNV